MDDGGLAELAVPVRDGLPVDLLRLMLQAVIGEERRDAYSLVRDLQHFSLVCKVWQAAAQTTPLRINLNYIPQLPWPALRWLQRMTIADLDINPNVPVNKVLTHPDFAARNQWVLERLWGAQLAGAPCRWPQFRHFPRLHTLELTCDTQAMSGATHPQHFESRVLAPLTQLKHLSLSHFGTADLSRLPLSLQVLQADLFTALPLALPPGLQLQELDLSCARLLVDWGQLCAQVDKLLIIEAPCIDLAAREGGGTLFRQAAAGFVQGKVAEVELVAQEVALVWLGGPRDEQGRQALPKFVPEQAYNPEVEESMHLVTLAADFQQHDFRQFSAVYNPDDLQANEELDMVDGITVRLHRHLPGQPQVLGFSYGLSEDQLAYLLAEASVEGLALEAVEAEDLQRVLNSDEFRRRNAGSLRWLAGLDLLGSLDLQAYEGLQRFEGYVLNEPHSLEAISQLPRGLTSLDICGLPKEEEEGAVEPADHSWWPDFAGGTAAALAQLTQLKDLSLRHFRDVALDGVLPASVEIINLECLRPRPPPAQPWYVRAVGGAPQPAAESFGFTLPPLEPGQQRTVHLQFHRNRDYPVVRPTLWLSQLLHTATRLVLTVSSDPPDPPENEEEAAEAEEEAEQRATLVLAADFPSLYEAFTAITASPLQVVEIEADEVLFTDAAAATFTGSRRVQQFIKAEFGATWIVFPQYEGPEDPDGAEAELGPPENAGFSMRRKGGSHVP